MNRYQRTLSLRLYPGILTNAAFTQCMISSYSYETLCQGEGEADDDDDGDLGSQWDDLTKECDPEDYFGNRKQGVAIAPADQQQTEEWQRMQMLGNPSIGSQPLPLNQLQKRDGSSSFASVQPTENRYQKHHQPLLTSTGTGTGSVYAYVIIDPSSPESFFLPSQLLTYTPPGSDQVVSTVCEPGFLPFNLLSEPQQPVALPPEQLQQMQMVFLEILVVLQKQVMTLQLK